MTAEVESYLAFEGPATERIRRAARHWHEAVHRDEETRRRRELGEDA